MCLIIDPLFVTSFRLYNPYVSPSSGRSLVMMYFWWMQSTQTGSNMFVTHNVQTSARSLFAASPELSSFRVQLNGTGTLHIHQPQDDEFEIDTNLWLGILRPNTSFCPIVVVQGLKKLGLIPRVLASYLRPKSGSQQGVFFSGLGLDRSCFFQFCSHR